ncbi:MAG: hypothetical protein ACE37F_19170 [Nannocystaceae bacterium]|nr:hypothetical protein [bacterium]
MPTDSCSTHVHPPGSHPVVPDVWSSPELELLVSNVPLEPVLVPGLLVLDDPLSALEVTSAAPLELDVLLVPDIDTQAPGAAVSSP